MIPELTTEVEERPADSKSAATRACDTTKMAHATTSKPCVISCRAGGAHSAAEKQSTPRGHTGVGIAAQSSTGAEMEAHAGQCFSWSASTKMVA